MKKIRRVEKEVTRLLTKISWREHVRFVVILELDDESAESGEAVVLANAESLYAEMCMMTQAIDARLQAAGEAGIDIVGIMKAVENKRVQAEQGTRQ